MIHPSCAYKMPGLFMSDPCRSCVRRGKYEVNGKLYCLQHAKKIEKKAIKNKDRLVK